MSDDVEGPEFPPSLGERFEVLALLGAGGLGTVWSARRRSDGRVLAVKVLRPEVAADPTVRERFRVEAAVGERQPRLHQPSQSRTRSSRGPSPTLPARPRS